MEEEGQGHSLGNRGWHSPFIWGRGTWKFIVGNVNTRGKIRNPVCVIHYNNKWTGGTDLKDRLLQMYLVYTNDM
jgi:hypothetical protein